MDLDAKAFYRRGNALLPRDTNAEEWLDTLKEGKEVLVSVRRARNPKHHRLLFAILKIVVDNTEMWPSPEVLLDDLKLATGLYEKRLNLLTGAQVLHPKSISFAAMSQDEFKPWFDKALTILARDVLCMLPEDLQREVYTMAGEDQPQPQRGAHGDT